MLRLFAFVVRQAVPDQHLTFKGTDPCTVRTVPVRAVAGVAAAHPICEGAVLQLHKQHCSAMPA